MQPITSALILGAVLWSQSAHADDAAAVTPYRPSVSSPAQLPAPGQLELELGGLSSKAAGQRRNSLPFAFKLGFNEEWGVVLPLARLWQ